MILLDFHIEFFELVNLFLKNSFNFIDTLIELLLYRFHLCLVAMFKLITKCFKHINIKIFGFFRLKISFKFFLIFTTIFASIALLIAFIVVVLMIVVIRYLIIWIHFLFGFSFFLFITVILLLISWIMSWYIIINSSQFSDSLFFLFFMLSYLFVNIKGNLLGSFPFCKKLHLSTTFIKWQSYEHSSFIKLDSKI